MNKNLYMTCISSIMLGLYLPKIMVMPVSLLIIGSFFTYVGLNPKEFFGFTKSKRNEDVENE